MSFFSAIANAVATEGKRIFVEAVGAGDGKIRLILTADVGQVPNDATPEMAKVYALMARPLVVVGTPAEVETALAGKLGQMRERLDEGNEVLDALRQLKEQAKSSAAKAASTPPKPAEADEQTKATPAPESPAAAPESTPLPASIGDAF
ncbi:PRTRC system protein E [Azotobacter chroococcum]|uniref:PRTRC system protein E n=1 Tax=Azotobacter chroococcum TaxID=353 RepID=UPI0010AE75A0|nr:PRTRC system protein E [Azotobacter chroococcum]TKD30756.1 PRTRC system protein E [Azotobacter chroococcum]